MAILVILDLGGDSFFFGRGVDSVAMLGHYIPVIEAMRHEQGSFHGCHLLNSKLRLIRSAIYAAKKGLEAGNICVDFFQGEGFDM